MGTRRYASPRPCPGGSYITGGCESAAAAEAPPPPAAESAAESAAAEGVLLTEDGLDDELEDELVDDDGLEKGLFTEAPRGRG